MPSASGTLGAAVYTGSILVRLGQIVPDELTGIGWRPVVGILVALFGRTDLACDVSSNFSGRTCAEGDKIGTQYVVPGITTMIRKPLTRKSLTRC